MKIRITNKIKEEAGITAINTFMSDWDTAMSYGDVIEQMSDADSWEDVSGIVWELFENNTPKEVCGYISDLYENIIQIFKGVK